MSILTVTCPKCGNRYQTSDLLRTVSECPACRTVSRVGPGVVGARMVALGLLVLAFIAVMLLVAFLVSRS